MTGKPERVLYCEAVVGILLVGPGKRRTGARGLVPVRLPRVPTNAGTRSGLRPDVVRCGTLGTFSEAAKVDQWVGGRHNERDELDAFGRSGPSPSCEYSIA